MKNLKSVFPIIFFLSLTVFVGCDKADEDNCNMTFLVFSGHEDCGLLLGVNLDDEYRILIPTNLEDFDITPSAGLEVCGDFESLQGKDDCGIGELVRFTSLSEK